MGGSSSPPCSELRYSPWLGDPHISPFINVSWKFSMTSSQDVMDLMELVFTGTSWKAKLTELYLPFELNHAPDFQLQREKGPAHRAREA
ncbi:hypothetical protein LIA77_08707 [Sarocladium implicatum]|nr:hypothetical protein LIA77_08707 [Sarocladium implicatum]